MKAHFHTVGDYSVMAERVDLNSEEGLNCTVSTMTEEPDIFGQDVD